MAFYYIKCFPKFTGFKIWTECFQVSLYSRSLCWPHHTLLCHIHLGHLPFPEGSWAFDPALMISHCSRVKYKLFSWPSRSDPCSPLSILYSPANLNYFYFKFARLHLASGLFVCCALSPPPIHLANSDSVLNLGIIAFRKPCQLYAPSCWLSFGTLLPL